jgi:hypothetical protein
MNDEKPTTPEPRSDIVENTPDQAQCMRWVGLMG